MKLAIYRVLDRDGEEVTACPFKEAADVRYRSVEAARSRIRQLGTGKYLISDLPDRHGAWTDIEHVLHTRAGKLFVRPIGEDDYHEVT
jgi:hypothetical protein